jgi:Pro-kumamolisin, activation domain
MATKPVPKGYVSLSGSERHPSPGAERLGPADPAEVFSVTMSLRRRPDGAALPSHEDFLATPPAQRQRMPNEEFARLYGASPQDIDKVRDFATSHGLAVLDSNAARRTVVVRGTTAQMNEAFAVDLGRYQHMIKQRSRSEAVRETYRGRDGVVHIPAALHGIVLGVFGLDNRRIGGRNDAEPPNTTTLDIPTVAKLYNYPTNKATGQTIGIVSESGYASADITTFFNSMPADRPAPTITDILIGTATNPGSDPFGETTQDIDIAAGFAPGAAINVYINNGDQQGWVDMITRVAHPDPGDSPCSVLSSSWFICDGDDPAGMDFGVTDAFITAVSNAFQDAAIQGVTVCIATGDRGTDSNVGDGKVHVQYPASDPWVLGVGGTTIGNVSGSTCDEYVWNDPHADDNWGTTGGGVSARFPVPTYQSAVAVPASLNDPAHHGRGVPDVAGNANDASGYAGIVLGNSTFTGNGTSASAPQWAGLIAVINAALGVNVGFVNPAIYALAGAGFRDIVPGPGPTDNANAGSPGYPAGAGWDACTGWGSPNGQALLDNLRAIYTRNLYFIVDKSTFGLDEVNDVIATHGGLFTNAFWLVLEGFSISQLGALTPTLSGPFKNLTGVSIFVDASGADYEFPGDLYTPQRIRIPYDILFGPTSVPSGGGAGDFPAAGADPIEAILGAQITIAGTALMAEALFELVSGADPYFTNVDPAHHQEFYLSQDLRVFSAVAGAVPLPGAPAMTSDPYQSLQGLLGFLNSNAAYTTPGPDQLNGLPGQSGYETGDSSVTPLAGGNKNFNFAIARVRLQGPASSSATNVRVFFRLFVAQSCDTDFQPDTTYKSQKGTGAEANRPVFPLPSGSGLADPWGNTLQTVPFFATDANGTHDYDGSNANANIRTITIPAGKDSVWAYFGCHLDVYNASNQSIFPGTHHCIVAEIAYDDAPIINAGGVTLSPENTDKLAQRNLQITSSGNPSYPDTHVIPQAFDTRPSRPLGVTGQLQDYPDELMIDWGNVPAGSTASIFWPQVNAADVLSLATHLYGAHPLSASDAHTITCKTTKGVTYVPIPPGTGNYAGLFTVELPDTIHVGQEFNVRVRRVASRRGDLKGVGLAAVPQQATINLRATTGTGTAATTTHFVEGSVGRGRKLMRNWRYVTGTFQVKVPVDTDKHLLRAEENTLAIFKWRLEHFTPGSRWRPVLERYIDYLSKRVDGFGGDATAVGPSLTGFHPKGHEGEGEEEGGETRLGTIGKVTGLIYDHFGDFEGFWLETEAGDERRWLSGEHQIENLVRRAWMERILIEVHPESHHAHRPRSITYRRASRPYQN